MTCPECGSPVSEVDGVIQYHTRLDDLTACYGPKPQAKQEQQSEPKPEPEPEAKPVKATTPRKRTTKK